MKSGKPEIQSSYHDQRPFLSDRGDNSIRNLLLLFLFISPFFMSLSTSTVWDANEAFYVQTPREMVDSGNWLIPEFNGNPRLNKPPLSYWLVAVFYQFLGVSILWERLLMAVLASLSIFSTFQIGKLLYSPEAGLLGAGIFATTFRFLIVSRRLMIDSLVLCAVLGAIALFLYWMKTRKIAIACQPPLFSASPFWPRDRSGFSPFSFWDCTAFYRKTAGACPLSPGFPPGSSFCQQLLPGFWQSDSFTAGIR